MKLPRCEDVRIPPEKVTGYLLSPSHAVGRFKARVFSALGFNQNDPEPFVAELRRIAAAEEVSGQEDTPYGRKYTVRGVLSGPTGTLDVATVWFLEPHQQTVRLVTVRPVE